MYTVLNEKEKQAFNSDIPMSIGVTDGKVAHMRYLVSPIRIRIDLDEVTDIPVLAFTDTSTKGIMEIMRLRKIDHTLTNMPDMFETMCNRAIKKFQMYAKLYKREKLIIYTMDELIMEVLLNRGFSIESIEDHSNTGYKATKKVDNEEKIDD